MYLNCENQYDLKIGMILLDIELNKEYVIIDYMITNHKVNKLHLLFRV